jgi:hypothetical protein
MTEKIERKGQMSKLDDDERQARRVIGGLSAGRSRGGWEWSAASMSRQKSCRLPPGAFSKHYHTKRSYPQCPYIQLVHRFVYIFRQLTYFGPSHYLNAPAFGAQLHLHQS